MISFFLSSTVSEGKAFIFIAFYSIDLGFWMRAKWEWSISRGNPDASNKMRIQKEKGEGHYSVHENVLQNEINKKCEHTLWTRTQVHVTFKFNH